MKNIDIYWFSGTGNTLLIAKEMKIEFEKMGMKVRLFPIEKTEVKKIDTSVTIGIVATVAMQGTYRIVWDFIENLPESKGTKCFFADTLAGYSGGVLGPVKNILKKKGYKTLSAQEFIMPSNFHRKPDASSKDEAVIKKSKSKIKNFCEDIKAEKENWNDIPGYSYLMSKISRSKTFESLSRKMMKIKIDHEKCIKCGLCVKLCPMNNLTGEGVPVPRKSCILCQRCVGFCPKNAISMSNKQSFQYRAVKASELLAELNKTEIQ